MYQGNKTNTKDFLEILEAAIGNSMRNCNVAEVARIISINEDEILCEVLSTGEKLTAVPISTLELLVDDVVGIIFTNTDFRANLKQIKAGAETNKIKNPELHRKAFGIIFGLIYRKEITE